MGYQDGSLCEEGEVEDDGLNLSNMIRVLKTFHYLTTQENPQSCLPSCF